MRIDVCSDLHGAYSNLEGGDLLIVAGDLTATDTHAEYLKFYAWLHRQKYKHYIFIAGNHDNLIEKGEVLADKLANTTYLCDFGTEFEWFETEDTKWGPKHLPGCRSLKLKIWGSPWSKTFHGMNPKCKAFTVNTEEELAAKFSLIPDDTDILITHCPPYGIFDEVAKPLRQDNEMICYARQHTGSDSLHAAILRIDPLIHCFGHIHEGYNYKKLGRTHFVNASHMNERYEPVNPPIRIEL